MRALVGLDVLEPALGVADRVELLARRAAVGGALRFRHASSSVQSENNAVVWTRHSRCRSTGSRGSVTVKVLPCPGVECTSMRPFAAASTRRTVARPRPVPEMPCVLRVVGPVELLEQAGLLGLAHADARVREPDLDPVRAAGRR